MNARARKRPLEGWFVEINLWGGWMEIESALSRDQAMAILLRIRGESK